MRWRRWVLAICGAGALLRLFAWWRGLPMWKDELWLVDNLASRGPMELFGALESAQAAPWGFLVVYDTVHAVSGGSAFALRAISLLASVTAICVFATFLRERYGRRSWTLIALGLLVFAPVLIYQAAEIKPYSIDVLVVCVLLLVWHRHGLGPRTILAGALAPWLSFPSVFVLAGIGVGHMREEPRRFVVAGSVWIGSFLPHWWGVIRPASQVDALRRFWSEGFAPAPAHVFPWIVERSVGYFRFPLWVVFPVVAIALTAVGVHWMRGRDRPMSCVLLVAVGSTLLAAMLGLYPFLNRPLTFLLPMGALALGASGAYMLELSGRARASGVALVLTMLLVNVAVSTIMAGCFTKEGRGGDRAYDGCLVDAGGPAYQTLATTTPPTQAPPAHGPAPPST